MRDAIVIVLRRGDRVLVARRGAAVKRPGYWAPPSGRVEPGESQADAVVREAREEIGVVVAAQREVWTCATDDGRYLMHWWLAAIVAGEPRPDGVEVDAVQWVTATEFLALAPTFDAHREFFAHVLPGLAATPPS